MTHCCGSITREPREQSYGEEMHGSRQPNAPANPGSVNNGIVCCHKGLNR